MEFIRELITPKRFNTFSFIVVICWITVGVLLLGIIAEIESSEQGSFSCPIARENNEYVQGQCLERFQSQYNTTLPFYCFVLVNFFLVGIVSVVYSQYAKPRIDDLEHVADLAETPSHPSLACRLIVAYCCQLGMRFILGILFIILQTQVLYPSGFLSNYKCSLSKAPISGENLLGIRNNKTRNSNETAYECHIPQAAKKTFWAGAVCVINGLFAFFALAELTFLIAKARMIPSFAEDAKFYKMHLLGKESKRPPFQVFVDNMKKRILRDTTHLQPLLPVYPGEKRLGREMKIDEIFTTLAVYRGRKNYTFFGERHDIFQEYLKQETNCFLQRVNRGQDILASDNESDGGIPHTILIIGRPGSGKTILCQKIIRDWANGKLFDNEKEQEIPFDFVALFKFRWFNSTDSLTLHESFSLSAHSGVVQDEIFRHICHNPEKILLIFDGLDEMKDNANISNEERYGDSITESMPLSALYGKLASGKLLAGATIITTTRATAVSRIAHLSFGKVVEILGFTSDQIGEYVRRFTADDSRVGTHILGHITSSANLLSLCYIPVTCFIVCSYFFELIKNFKQDDASSGPNMPSTLTEIYKGLVKMFVLKHSSEYRNLRPSAEVLLSEGFPPSVQETLAKLGELALKGTTEGRLLFESNEVRGLEESGLIHRLPNKQTAPLTHQAQFCFIHLTVQEYFAASELLRGTRPQDLRRFVALHIAEGKWQLVLQFVAGLLRDREVPKIDIFSDLLPASFEMRALLLWQCNLSWWPAGKDKELTLTVCKCIHEYLKLTPPITQRTAMIEKKGVNMSLFKTFFPTDCEALVHVLKSVKEIPWLDLDFNLLGSLGCIQIGKLLPFGNLFKLSIAGNDITDDGVRHLADALAQKQCKLKWLNLTANHKLTDVGIKLLCNALSCADCNLTTLVLDLMNLKDAKVKYLAETISKKECKINELHLSSNSISDTGAKYLAEALSQRECKLIKLDVSRNRITDVGIKHFSDALCKLECKLRKLDLSFNEITDVGGKYFIETVAKYNFTIRELDLSGNDKISKDTQFQASIACFPKRRGLENI